MPTGTDPRVVFLTAANLPIPDVETPTVIAALAERGIAAAMLPWTQPLPASTELAVIRSTWDYTSRPAAFLAALAAIDAPVLNPVDTVQWNSHKGYLVELAHAGLPVVPTTVVRPGEAVDWPSGPVVVKPAISVGALDTARYDHPGAASQAHVDRLLLTGDVLVQPFVADVADGEISLIYLDRTLSHAVRKYPAPGDYRVQPHLGGRVLHQVPTSTEIAVGEAVLGSAPGELLYARVDLVGSDAGPLLMELELIEPYLFLPEVARSATRFAAAVASKI